MVDRAVLLGDEQLLLPAIVVQAAVLHEIGVDVAQEPDAPGVELLDGALEVGVELLVRLPVPPDLLAHDGPILPGPVLAPHAGDLGPRVQHGEGLGEDGLGAPLDGEDHALPAPVRDVLPVGDAVSQQQRQGFVALPLQQRQLPGAAVEGKGVSVIQKAGDPVGLRVEEEQAALVRDEDGHGGVAADGAVGLFLVQAPGQQGFFQNGGGLDVLGDEVHHVLAPQISLPILLPAAEDGLPVERRQGEGVGPARFPGKH